MSSTTATHGPGWNAGFVYRNGVPARADGRTVLAHHAAEFRHSTPEQWREHVESGRVLVNGECVSVDHVLHAGDRLEFRRPPWHEAEVPLWFRVVYEDDDLLAVEKPTGLQVLPAGGFLDHTLLRVVQRSTDERATWAPVHRLGRGTTGIVLGAKTSAGRAALSAQFLERTVTKTYLAVVAGTDLPTSLAARHPIGPVAHDGGMAHSVTPDGRPSLTLIRVLGRDPAAGTSLVAAQPVTGRSQQIRIHLAACGAPLVGDTLYGPGPTLRLGARTGDIGYRLHATSLRFVHPATGELVRLRCAPPW